MLMMERLVVILFTLALLALPLRAVVFGGCLCTSSPNTIEQTRTTDSSHACCAPGLRDSEAPDGEEQPRPTPCHEDCPRSCCATVSIVAAPAPHTAARFTELPTYPAPVADFGSPSVAHVLGLKRPPRTAAHT